MATYCITFRIADKTVGGKTYDDRYQLLLDNAHEGSDGFWAETTAFLLVGSNLDTPSFAKKICRGLSVADDLVLVFDPGDMSANYFGPIKHLDALRSFFPTPPEAHMNVDRHAKHPSERENQSHSHRASPDMKSPAHWPGLVFRGVPKQIIGTSQQDLREPADLSLVPVGPGKVGRLLLCASLR